VITKTQYSINAEAQYRQVYQGTKYTVSWEVDGKTKKAESRNMKHLMQFVQNGFSTTGLGFRAARSIKWDMT